MLIWWAMLQFSVLILILVLAVFVGKLLRKRRLETPIKSIPVDQSAYRWEDEPLLPVERTPEGKLWAKLAIGICPDCGAAKGFWEGPSGGLSTNIQCVACDAWFNVTPVIGIAERIKR